MLDWFPFDIIHLILSSLPDGSTLNTAIQLNKHIRSVFLKYPNAIRSSAAHNAWYNEVGPALPQACYFAIVQRRFCDHDPELLPDDFAGLLDDLPKDDFTSISVALASPALAHKITENAKMLSTLENHYSQRYKDPTATTSSLTWSQSFKFSRALYRAWSYSLVFNARYACESDNMESSDPPLLEERLALLREQQRIFLLGMRMDDEEKQQFCAVISFLHDDLSRWISNSIDRFIDHDEGGPFYPRPCDILDAAKYLSFRQQLVAREPDLYGLPDDIGTALFEFENAPTFFNTTLVDPPSMAILDAQSPQHICVKCSATRALCEVYNHSSWNLIHGDVKLPDIMHIAFPAHILQNRIQRERIERHLDNNFAKVMHELVNRATAHGKALTPQDWLCLSCVRDIFRAHMMDWWLERTSIN